MIGIHITRYPYEEPHHLCLRIEASNGRVSGELEYYCNAGDLKMLGKQLADYLGKRGDEIGYELGSEAPDRRFAFFLSLQVKPLDSFGHTGLFVHLNNNQAGLDQQMSRFAIAADPADIQRLGKLLIAFGELRHRRLEWQVHEGRLIAENEATED